jgi:hypothetical protein
MVVSRYSIKPSAISFISWGSVRRACGMVGTSTDNNASFSYVTSFGSMVFSRSMIHSLVTAC